MNDFLLCIIGILGSTLLSYIVQKSREPHKLLEVDNITIKTTHRELKSETFATIIWIINKGNCNIEPKDFAPKSPLKIFISEGKLLNQKKFFEGSFYKSDTDNFRMKVKQNSIEILFDFWSPNERIRIFLIHTGKVNINGFLKDGEIINSDTMNKIRTKNIIIYSTTFLIVTLAIISSFNLIDNVPFFFGGIIGMLITILEHKIKSQKIKGEAKQALYNWSLIRIKELKKKSR